MSTYSLSDETKGYSMSIPFVLSGRIHPVHFSILPELISSTSDKLQLEVNGRK